MRDVKFCLTLVMGIFMPILAGAVDSTEDSVRAGVQKESIAKPITSKKLYRLDWQKDNSAPLSLMEQLGSMEQNPPEMDEDMKIIMQNGIKLMKKMDFDLENQDSSDDDVRSSNNQEKATQNLSEGPKINMTLADVVTAATETIEPGKRLMEKSYQDKSLGRFAYPINVDEF